MLAGGPLSALRKEDKLPCNRDFLSSGVALAVAAEVEMGKAHAFVPTHNWDKYDFGSGPAVTDRLNQGPFPQYQLG